jgi:hypothetical protein
MEFDMRYLKNLALAAVVTLLSACGGGESSLTRPTALVARALQSTASTNVDAAMCTESTLASGAYQWLGSQCTLASALMSATVVTPSQSRALVRSATAAAAVATSTTTTVDASAFFDWAEATYPTLFPGHKANLTNPTFVVTVQPY